MPDNTGTGDAERLAILIEARLNDLEKNMAKASGITAKAYREMTLGSKKATTQMENDAIRASLSINKALATIQGKVGAFSKSFTAGALAPVTGLLTLTAAIGGTKAALDKFSKINDQSIAAGIDPEFFQGIAYQAKLSGVEIDNVADALETFAKNAGLAAEGKGRMVATLQALNPELLRNITAATTQEQRIRLVADAIKNAKDQAQAAAIASAAFGDSGTKLVQAFSAGGDEIDRTVAKAKEMGIVVDRDVIAHADELGDKWDTVAGIIDTKVKTALVGLAPQMIWLVDMAAKYADYISKQASGQAPMNIPNWGPVGSPQMNQHIRDMLGDNSFLGIHSAGAVPETSLNGGEYPFGDMSAFFNDATSKNVADLLAPPPDVNSLGVLPTNFDFRNVLDTVTKTTKAAHDATIAVGTTSDAVDKLNEQWQTAEDLANSFAETLTSDLEDGKGLVESLGDAFKSLEAQLVQMALNQAIKSLFSSLMGLMSPGLSYAPGVTSDPWAGLGLPGHADGIADTGGVRGQPRGIVHGREAVIPLPSGGKVPVLIQGQEGRDSYAAPQYTINLNVSGATDPMSFRKSEGQLTTMLARMINRAHRVS